MAIVEASHSKLIALKNNDEAKSCTATAAMVIVNNDIYCVRSKKENKQKLPVVLHKIFNHLGSGNENYECVEIQTASGNTNIAVHANSLTYYNHIFYLATRNTDNASDQVVAFSSDGKISSQYSYGKEVIATINFYQKKNDKLYFLISIGGGCSIDYRLVYISGNKLKDANIKFKVLIPDNDYSVGNDSYFSTADRQLYVTKIRNSEDKTTENKIFQYDLSGDLSGTDATYSPIRTIHAASNQSESKFEIEGLSIYNGVKYVCTNSLDLANKQKDEICKIYKS